MTQTVVDEVMLREPRLLVPRMQPLGPVKLAAPYNSGDSFAAIGNRLIGLGGGAGVMTAVGTTSLVPGEPGIATNTDGAAGSYFVFGKRRYAVAGQTTWVVLFKSAASGGPDYISGTVNDGSSYLEDLMINSAGESFAAGSLELFLRETGGTAQLRAHTGNIGINDNRLHCVVWRLVSPTALSCVVDGAAKALTYSLTGTLNIAAGTVGHPIWLHTRNVRNNASGGSDATQYLYLYARLNMLEPDPVGLSLDPFRIFDPA